MRGMWGSRDDRVRRGLATFLLLNWGAAVAGDEGVPGTTTAITATSLPLTSATTLPTASTLRHGAPLTCPATTVNYITHGLPQQCLRKTWTGNGQEDNGSAAEEAEASTALYGDNSAVILSIDVTTSDTTTVIVITPPAPEHAPPSSTDDLDPESPLDTANFLSFEEWKKQNLARAGQSLDAVGQARPADRPRRMAPPNNALDSLGDDAEIDLDFGGFGGSSSSEPTRWNTIAQKQEAPADGKPAVPGKTLRKDAGKTCKERFNYASFDCAATVLKSNNEAKSTSSILVENKDTYLLNECSADNKHVIIELCDDILVDTVVLANYEFFSSMFRTFRVSVSDRYPPRQAGWRDLGIFEARNERGIQAFAVVEPLIWARYLKIDFLTHYGNEFYCPVSLLRVHGTTMMEEFRAEEATNRGEEEAEEVAETVEVQKNAEVSTQVQTPVETAEPSIEAPKAISETVTANTSVSADDKAATRNVTESADTQGLAASNQESKGNASTTSSNPAVASQSRESSSKEVPEPVSSVSDISAVPIEHPYPKSTSQPDLNKALPPQGSDSSGNGSMAISKSPSSQSSERKLSSVTNNAPSPSTPTPDQAQKSTKEAKDIADFPKPPSSSTHQNPPAASPSTQESFFKSVHKRLQALEANSTLSLQYIEAQSRILRDAFTQVEKRQAAKTSSFLSTLNTTVTAELHSFRMQYDQLWQFTVSALESHRELQAREMAAISSRLTLVADELVFQKRVIVVQSTLLLLCLGLVLFARSVATTQADLPLPLLLDPRAISKHAQSLLRHALELSPPDSPAVLPESRGDSPSPTLSASPSPGPEGRRAFRSHVRGMSSGDDGDVECDEADGDHDESTLLMTSPARASGEDMPAISFQPPTPAKGVPISPSPSPSPVPRFRKRMGEEASVESDDLGVEVPLRQTQSGPATPSGHRGQARDLMEEVAWDESADEGGAGQEDGMRDAGEDDDRALGRLLSIL
ncbi:hypothetical protein EJ06DRAFT_526712 [Trichodelitschia bisporula]|uniref:SUN-like protein 1 n=1 Tax=Trichodelitschia bisporula TaxID=703511 RepID=A0A6G1I8J5_9PEZI|nr:hypothetical protein EJ06DRAFT_526712 [Trichodelitschia bisporula]